MHHIWNFKRPLYRCLTKRGQTHSKPIVHGLGPLTDENIHGTCWTACPCKPSVAHVRVLDGSNYMSVWFVYIQMGMQARKEWNGIGKLYSFSTKEGKGLQVTNYFLALDKFPLCRWKLMAVTISFVTSHNFCFFLGTLILWLLLQ